MSTGKQEDNVTPIADKRDAVLLEQLFAVLQKCVIDAPTLTRENVVMVVTGVLELAKAQNVKIESLEHALSAIDCVVALAKRGGR